MKREIKFRAWMKPDKVMLSHEQLMSIPVTYHDVFEGNSKYPCMQCTGLLDKNGIEIYEGDIVSSGRGKGMAVIYQAPKFVMKEKIKSGFSKCWSEFILSPDQNQFEEVIGNIYENPELLEDQP